MENKILNLFLYNHKLKFNEIEKEIKADVRGILANKKEEPFGNKKCLICGKSAEEVVYIGKSY